MKIHISNIFPLLSLQFNSSPTPSSKFLPISMTTKPCEGERIAELMLGISHSVVLSSTTPMMKNSTIISQWEGHITSLPIMKATTAPPPPQCWKVKSTFLVYVCKSCRKTVLLCHYIYRWTTCCRSCLTVTFCCSSSTSKTFIPALCWSFTLKFNCEICWVWEQGHYLKPVSNIILKIIYIKTKFHSRGELLL